MTQEEKAKAYDEALKQAEVLHKLADETKHTNTKMALEKLFPQLVESEDERIRKALLKYFSEPIEHESDAWLFEFGIENKDVIAYLEKQKEQKPTEYLDLDNASQDYVYNHFCSGADFTPDYIKGLMEDAFVDGANWQREQTPGITEKNPINPFDTKLFQDGVKEGRRLEREDMLKEQKPAEWSEEDEDNLKRAINICVSDFGEGSETAKFLKSLPERFSLQPKQEWSEEDARCLRFIKCNLEYLKREDKAYRSHDDQAELQKELNFISKVLTELAPPQPHWKPSEEQMEALEIACTIREGERNYYLHTLYDDLKKL